MEIFSSAAAGDAADGRASLQHCICIVKIGTSWMVPSTMHREVSIFQNHVQQFLSASVPPAGARTTLSRPSVAPTQARTVLSRATVAPRFARTVHLNVSAPQKQARAGPSNAPVEVAAVREITCSRGAKWLPCVK